MLGIFDCQIPPVSRTPSSGGTLICALCVLRGIRYVYFFPSDPYSAFSIYGVAPTKPGTSVIIWPSTKLNIATNNATHYDTSTGKYCAEYYGLYMFNLHLYKISEQGSSKCYIFKESQSGMMSGLAQASVGSSSLESSTTTIVELGQGECVYVGGCSGFSFLSSFTSFSGTLIHYLLD